MSKLKLSRHSKMRWGERLGTPDEGDFDQALVEAIPGWVLKFAGSGSCTFRNNAGEVFVIKNGVVVTVWQSWPDMNAANDPREE